MSFIVAAGKRAAEPDVCRSGSAQGPDAWREWPGYSQDQRTLLCMPGGFLENKDAQNLVKAKTLGLIPQRYMYIKVQELSFLVSV